MKKSKKILGITQLITVLIFFSLLCSNIVYSETYNPVEISNWNTIDCYDICVKDNLAFVSSNIGLVIIDISIPENPIKVCEMKLQNGSYGLSVVGNYAYLTADYAGLIIVDISDASNPKIVSQISNGDIALRVLIQEDIAFVSFLTTGILIIDISNPLLPKIISNFNDSFGRDMRIKDDILFFCSPVEGLKLVDISDKTSPTMISIIPDTREAYDAFIDNNFLYLARLDRGISIFDISNSHQPILTDEYVDRDGGVANGIFEKDGLLYVADGYSIELYDVSNPYEIIKIGQYEGERIHLTQDLIVDENNVFVVQNGGIFILKFLIENKVENIVYISVSVPLVLLAIAVISITLILKIRKIKRRNKSEWPLIFRPKII